ncbi:hypothetical protein BDV11DRAFT_173700 [Aspergillus similis]
MPVEIRAFAAGKYAQVAASRVVTPVTAVAKTATSKYKPNWVKETAIKAAYQVVRPGGNAPDAAVPPLLENGPEASYYIRLTLPRDLHKVLNSWQIAVKNPSDRHKLYMAILQSALGIGVSLAEEVRFDHGLHFCLSSSLLDWGRHIEAQALTERRGFLNFSSAMLAAGAS